MKKILTFILLFCCSLSGIQAQNRILEWSIGDVTVTCGQTTQICYQVQVAIDDDTNSPELATSTFRFFYDAGLLENLSINNVQSNYSVSGLTLGNDVYGGVFGFSGGNGGVYVAFNLDAPTSGTALDLGTSAVQVFDLCFDVIANSTYPLCTPIVFDNNHTGWDNGISSDDSYLPNNAGMVGTYYLSGNYNVVELADDEVTNYSWQENPGFDGEVNSLSDDVGSTITTACIEDVCNADIAIIKTSSLSLGVDGNADVGDMVNYTYTVTNTGPAKLFNVEVDESLGTFTGTNTAPVPGSETLSMNISGNSMDASTDGVIDELAPGDQATFTASYILSQADIDAGQLSNQAIAMGTPAFGGPSVMDLSDDDSNLEDDITQTPIPQNPVIAIVKVGDFQDENMDNFAQVGETIDYTFTVSNQGNVPLDNVVLTDPLLEAPNVVVSISGPSGDTGSDGVLGMTETWTYTATYTITQVDIDAGGVMNQATATADSPLDVEVSDMSDDDSPVEDDVTETPVPQGPALSVIKSVTSTTGNRGVGAVITYAIEVTNTGNTSVSNIEITDANAVIVNGNPIVLLLPGQSATVTATHIITQGEVEQGYVENTAIATGDSPQGTDDVSDDSDAGTDPYENPITDPETVETPDGAGITDSNPANDPTVTQLCTELSLFVNLEGSLVNPQGGGYLQQMRTTLNNSRLLPGQFNENAFEGNKYIPILGAEGQAFNISPWNYSGSEGDYYDSQSMSANADANYPSTVVDWVLVSLRSSPDNGGEMLCQRAGLLHDDGRITFPSDADCCTLDYDASYYVVIEHRNHLIIMSDQAVAIVNGVLTYDFRDKQSYINDFLGTGTLFGQKEVSPGVFAMYAGNGDQSTSLRADTDISGSDITLVQNSSPDSRVYNLADYNMDGEISALDLALLLLNNPRFTSVPRN